MSTRLLLNPCLKPGILDWNVSSAYEIPQDRLQKFQEAATTPPTRSMTLIIPGYPFHLPPLTASPLSQKEHVSVVDVVAWIYHAMNNMRLGTVACNDIQGLQMYMARESCYMRKAVAMDLKNDSSFRENIRVIDLVRGRLYLDGLLYQRDSNGANVWVVNLQEPKEATSSPYLPQLLAPGHITWDFKDAPPALDSAQTDSFGVAGEPMVIRDTSGRSSITLNPPSECGGVHPFTPAMVLKYIHSKIMNRDNKRFLGLWYNQPSSNCRAHYTIFTQLSARPVPKIHHALQQGCLKWSIFADPGKNTSASWMAEPATSPACEIMDISIEFMPGVSWTLTVFPARGARYVTARRVLSMMYQFLVKDEFEISWVKMPMHLQRRMKQRAWIRDRRTASNAKANKSTTPVSSPSKAKRIRTSEKADERKTSTVTTPKKGVNAIMTKEELRESRRRRQKALPNGFKRIDVLEVTMCVGIQHRISSLGEDEWVVLLNK